MAPVRADASERANWAGQRERLHHHLALSLFVGRRLSAGASKPAANVFISLDRDNGRPSRARLEDQDGAPPAPPLLVPHLLWPGGAREPPNRPSGSKSDDRIVVQPN